jgi:DNA-directed RNA polymerase specialized sigma subunit
MEKKELRKIPGIVKEIEFLKKQIEYAEASAEHTKTVDIVKGSAKHFPYNEKMYLIEGVDRKGHDKKVKRLKAQYQRRIDELMDKVKEAQEYIAKLEDWRLRLILQCRYINGLTWEQVEYEMGIPLRTIYRLHKNWRDFGA